MSFFYLKNDTKIFRKMGYFTDQEGIMRRYIREANSWKPHLDHTKQFILNASKNKERNKAAILGSGWLLDVPLAQLAEDFAEVWLFDIKHPSPIRRKVENLKNIKLIETDISGFAVAVHEMAKAFRKSNNILNINNLKPRFDFELQDFDFVVSCNMLDQLDIILVDYLKKKCILSVTDEMQLRRLVQDFHLSLLPKTKSCVISDAAELWVDGKGDIKQTKPLVYTDKLSDDLEDSWIWHFDNNYTYHSSYKTWFKVIAVEI
jgi:hypothetical protein